jgi:hypothetical protein
VTTVSLPINLTSSASSKNLRVTFFSKEVSSKSFRHEATSSRFCVNLEPALASVSILTRLVPAIGTIVDGVAIVSPPVLHLSFFSSAVGNSRNTSVTTATVGRVGEYVTGALVRREVGKEEAINDEIEGLLETLELGTVEMEGEMEGEMGGEMEGEMEGLNEKDGLMEGH